MTEMSKELQKRFAAEFLALEGLPPIALRLTRQEAWMILSTLQLACRHPHNTGACRRAAERFARDLQAQCAKSGALSEVAEMGWDPSCDVTAKG